MRDASGTELRSYRAVGLSRPSWPVELAADAPLELAGKPCLQSLTAQFQLPDFCLRLLSSASNPCPAPRLGLAFRAGNPPHDLIGRGPAGGRRGLAGTARRHGWLARHRAVQRTLAQGPPLFLSPPPPPSLRPHTRKTGGEEVLVACTPSDTVPIP